MTIVVEGPVENWLLMVNIKMNVAHFQDLVDCKVYVCDKTEQTFVDECGWSWRSPCIARGPFPAVCWWVEAASSGSEVTVVTQPHGAAEKKVHHGTPLLHISRCFTMK